MGAVAIIMDKMRENRLKWIEHVLRWEKAEAVIVLREFILKERGGRKAKRRLEGVIESNMR